MRSDFEHEFFPTCGARNKHGRGKSKLLSVAPRSRFLLLFLLLMVSAPVQAQLDINTIHGFTVGQSDYLTNRDGMNPQGGLILSGNTLFGTTMEGGTFGNGSVFRVNTDGTGFASLHSFPFRWWLEATNTDGAYPVGRLVLSEGTLYGTAREGGAWGQGTVFAISTNGAGFRDLYDFSYACEEEDCISTNSDGKRPLAGLVLSGNTLYGTASEGGNSASGTVFKLNTDGMGFTVLYSFSQTSTTSAGARTNTDGAYPATGLVLSGNTLYGTASAGGPWGNGTVFAINTDGTGFTNLHSFSRTSGTNMYGGIGNLDGIGPKGRLLLSGNTLYGTTSAGGDSGSGTVFAVHTDGTGFADLCDFTTPLFWSGAGIDPEAELVLSGNTLYGTTTAGGGGTASFTTHAQGTVFTIRTDGTGFTTLYSFLSYLVGSSWTNFDGYAPRELLLLGNVLYGTASWGGTHGGGCVFALPLSPPLSLMYLGRDVVLTWPTNFIGFTLQSTTNLFLGPWSTVSPTPVVANGRNTVTIRTFGTTGFFRLSK